MYIHIFGISHDTFCNMSLAGGSASNCLCTATKGHTQQDPVVQLVLFCQLDERNRPDLRGNTLIMRKAITDICHRQS